MNPDFSFFFDKVTPEPNSGCWLWAGYVTAGGYGRLRVCGAEVYAHRLSWLLHHGSEPSSMFVCHRCDNPACVNPGHLFLGTSADNALDMKRKGRARNAPKRGEDHPKTNLTVEDVRAIRSAAGDGEQMKSIAQRFGVCKSTVFNVAHRITWAHVE